jgi:hypothetical protein
VDSARFGPGAAEAKKPELAAARSLTKRADENGDCVSLDPTMAIKQAEADQAAHRLQLLGLE